jgi:prepilin signal peptidase PulO-like enzyme (type II secretory pathway)
MTILLFIYGLFFGSLLNVLIYRLPRSLHWISNRSFCPHCQHRISWYDLIPLASWALLRGKCQHCRKPISPLYPVIELTNGLLWVAVAWMAQHHINLAGIGSLGWSGWELFYTAAALILFSTLLLILVIDLQHYIIPDQAVITVILLAALISFTNLNLGHWHILDRLIWASGLGLFFYSLHYFTRGKGMGFGDVKLAFAIGLLLKQFSLVAIFTSFLTGAIVGVALLILKQKKLKQPIPFGPFLVLGTVLGMIYGNQVIQWYLLQI